MYKVGITGNRFSGKNKVCGIFAKDYTIPVFDVDIVVKFILMYNQDIISIIKDLMGDKYILNKSVNVKAINRDKKFSEVIDIIEDEVFVAYEKFIERKRGVVYSVFKCSFLFEAGWDKKMDFVVNVYTPYLSRIERGRRVTGKTVSIVDDIMRTETDELKKNEKANITIHNYNEFDIKKQVYDIDNIMINKYLTDAYDTV